MTYDDLIAAYDAIREAVDSCVQLHHEDGHWYAGDMLLNYRGNEAGAYCHCYDWLEKIGKLKPVVHVNGE